MARRVWLLAMVLAAVSLFAVAAASAKPIRHSIGGTRHAGKPRVHHLIAIRHGRHIVWLSKTHGLPRKHLPTIKLSPDVSVSHGLRAHATFGPTSAPTVTGIGDCHFNAQTSSDGMVYVQSYGPLYGDVLNCVGNNGGNVESNSYYPAPTCDSPDNQSVKHAPLEYATFADGEWIVLCTVPDDNGSGDSQANDDAAPYTVYQQGFGCEAAIGIGLSDGTADAVRTNDSLEYYQQYTESGQTVTAVTTTCVGQLASNVTVASSPVTHLVSCTQYDPQAPGKYLRGLGETITYPDRQYQETCNVPDYRQSVVCVPGQSCSTTAFADATSDATVTANPNGEQDQDAGTLTESVDLGNQLSCQPRQYGGYTGFDANWYQYNITGSADKQITYVLFGVSADAGIQICFGATAQFPAASDDGEAQPGTLPDGTAGYIGLLQGCPDTPTFPCIESILPLSQANFGTGSVVTVDVPQTFPGDPAFHG
jgi:hypothetical protein